MFEVQVRWNFKDDDPWLTIAMGRETDMRRIYDLLMVSGDHDHIEYFLGTTEEAWKNSQGTDP